MTPRTQQRAPKGRDRDRADRRAVADVLLARLHRGALSPAEAALLAEHMREEQRIADESRRAMAGTTQALERHRAAADEAIVEAEQRAAQAEARTKEAQRVAAEQRAAVDRILALVDRHDVVPAAAVWAAVDADPVEHRKADDRARRWKDDQSADRAAVSRVRTLARTLRAGSPMGAAAIYAERIEQALDNDRRALDADTAIRAQFAAAADSTEARLTEQKRDHDIALATVQAATKAAEKRIRGYEAVFGPNAVDDFHAMQHRAKTAEARLASIRTMADAWIHRLPATIRTATAAAAVRRAAEGDDSPVMFAMTAEPAAEQQLAAVRAVLPTEPRPRLGLPTDLAYENGWHDLAATVREALNTHQNQEHPTT